MKLFRDYLAESQKTYNYRIKIAGDVSPEFMRGLKEKMAQFEPVKIGELKSTPVQKVPTDFPNFENERINFFDVEFRYPAIHPQITNMAQMLGLDPNRLIMHTLGYDLGMDEEMDGIKEKNQNLLADTDYPGPDKIQKAASKEYAADSHDHEVVRNRWKSNFKIAGGKTPPAETTNDLPMGDKSPIGGQNRLPSVKSNAR